MMGHVYFNLNSVSPFATSFCSPAYPSKPRCRRVPAVQCVRRGHHELGAHGGAGGRQEVGLQGAAAAEPRRGVGLELYVKGCASAGGCLRCLCAEQGLRCAWYLPFLLCNISISKIKMVQALWCARRVAYLAASPLKEACFCRKQA